MTAPLAEYRLDEVRISANLGEGGAAKIYRCETADGKPMVLKRYHEETLEDLDAEALRDLIDWPAQLPVNDRERLMKICAWPQAAVSDGGAVIGVLMDAAPTKFFFRRNDNPEPCHFTYLAVTKEHAQQKNWPYYDFPHKIARLGHLLEALQFLHSYKVVVGDLQPNNVLTTSPEPDATGRVTTEIFLLDCDSVIVDGRPALPPMDPLNMRPPYKVDGHSATTDLYKFAKLTIRRLSEDLAVETIHYDKFSNVLPSRDFETLDKLLTLPDPGLTADDLRNLARAWQTTVKPDGRLFCRTNRSLREPWTEEKRQAHLADLGPPKVAVTPSREVGEGAQAPRMVTCPNGHANPEHQRYCGECGAPVGATVSVPRSATPIPHPPGSAARATSGASAGPSRRAKIAIGALIVLVTIVVLSIIGNQSNSNNPSNSNTTQPSPSDTAQPSPSDTAQPNPSDTSSVIRAAQVDDCLNVAEGADNGDGTKQVPVTQAQCGSPDATDRVTKRTNTTSDCGNSKWVQNKSSDPPVVLCLVQP
jgi:hypothetical protein